MSATVERTSLVGRVKTVHNNIFRSSKASADGVSHEKSGITTSSNEEKWSWANGANNSVQAQPEDNDVDSDDELFLKLRREAAEVAK